MRVRMQQLSVMSLVVWGLITAQALGASFYSDRPHIAEYTKQRPQAFSARNKVFFHSLLNFVVQLRILFPHETRVYLGRDGELLHDLDWLIWQLVDKEKGPEPRLINISRKSVQSPHLIQYLKDQKLLDISEEALLIDTGYEGSVIEAINGTIAKKKRSPFRSFLISSAHDKSPSSRVSTEAYLSSKKNAANVSAKYKETFLDLVDRQIVDIEGAAHFTDTAVEFRANPKIRLMDAYAPQDASEEEQEESRELQREMWNFFSHTKETQKRIELLRAGLGPLIEGLRLGPVSQGEIQKAQKIADGNGFSFFFADLREACGRGTLSLNPEGLFHLWETLGGKPVLFDLEPDQEAEFLKLEGDQSSSFRSDEAAVSAKRPLIEDIMEFHAKEQRSEQLERSEKALQKVRREVEEGYLTIEGEKTRVVKVLDEGVRGEVFLVEGDRVAKIPFEADDVRYMEVEIQVATFLTEHFDRYQIPVLPILSMGKKGTFVIRSLLDPSSLGTNFSRKDLSKKQLDNLQLLYERSKRFAEETGVGLDIKFDNLAWLDNQWVLFDVGPRTSYGPYAFTLDIPTFDDFFRLWKDDRPRKNGLTVDAFIANWHHRKCSIEMGKLGGRLN